MTITQKTLRQIFDNRSFGNTEKIILLKALANEDYRIDTPELMAITQSAEKFALIYINQSLRQGYLFRIGASTFELNKQKFNVKLTDTEKTRLNDLSEVKKPARCLDIPRQFYALKSGFLLQKTPKRGSNDATVLRSLLKFYKKEVILAEIKNFWIKGRYQIVEGEITLSKFQQYLQENPHR